MVVTDAEGFGVERTLEMAERVCFAAEPGSVLVQLRDRNLKDERRLAVGERLRALTRRAGQWLSVNERVDLAVLLEADSLHLPERGPPATRVHALLAARGREVFLSAAGHDPERPPSDVQGWVLSPIVSARKGRAPLGFEALARAVEHAGARRVFALGGVTDETAPRCRELGAGVAVMKAAYEAPLGLVRSLGLERRGGLSEEA
jgi:thiamine-phosphate pyrophosphorylase